MSWGRASGRDGYKAVSNLYLFKSCAKQRATYSFSDFEVKVLPQPWQDSEVDDPAWDGTALRFFRTGGGATGRANFPKLVLSDTL